MKITTVEKLSKFYKDHHPDEDLALLDGIKHWIVSYERDSDGELTIFLEPPDEEEKVKPDGECHDQLSADTEAGDVPCQQGK